MGLQATKTGEESEPALSTSDPFPYVAHMNFLPKAKHQKLVASFPPSLACCLVRPFLRPGEGGGQGIRWRTQGPAAGPSGGTQNPGFSGPLQGVKKNSGALGAGPENPPSPVSSGFSETLGEGVTAI